VGGREKNDGWCQLTVFHETTDPYFSMVGGFRFHETESVMVRLDRHMIGNGETT